jgi:hypothetical protein
MGFFSNIINTVKQSTRSRFDLHKETNTVQLLLNTKDEEYFTLEFSSMDVESLYDPSVQNGYKILGTNESLGILYIEAIKLRYDQKWNVSAGSAFDRFIKEQFKNSELRYLDSFSGHFVKLSKYQLNFENEFGVIWFSLNTYEVFIIDPKGKIFNDLIEIYTIKNKNLIIKDTENELVLNIPNSLTSTNIREHYFSKNT